MESTISEWGNSLGLRIPKAFAKEIGLEKGSKVAITAENGKLIVKPVKPYSLKFLVSQITPENRYEETDFGTPEGMEVW